MVMHSHTRLAAYLPPARVSQVPRLICPRALSPLTPESPTNAPTHCFFAGGRLQALWHLGHSHFV